MRLYDGIEFGRDGELVGPSLLILNKLDLATVHPSLVCSAAVANVSANCGVEPPASNSKTSIM